PRSSRAASRRPVCGSRTWNCALCGIPGAAPLALRSRRLKTPFPRRRNAMRMRASLLLPVCPVLAVALAAAKETPATKSSEPATAGRRVEAPLLKSLKARSIGPAVMGGRVSDIALDPENPFVFYIGLATGGIAQTKND